MTERNAPKKQGAGILPPLLALAVAALGGLIYWLWDEAGAAALELERAKSDYRNMANMRRAIQTLERGAPAAAPKPGEADLQPYEFLSRKAREAKLPSERLSLNHNQDADVGAWTEMPFTVSIRQSKEEPVSRDAVAAFLGRVERERPTIKSKNLTLDFDGYDLKSFSVTFSAFKRAEKKAPAPKR